MPRARSPRRIRLGRTAPALAVLIAATGAGGVWAASRPHSCADHFWRADGVFHSGAPAARATYRSPPPDSDAGARKALGVARRFGGAAGLGTLRWAAAHTTMTVRPLDPRNGTVLLEAATAGDEPPGGPGVDDYRVAAMRVRDGRVLWARRGTAGPDMLATDAGHAARARQAGVARTTGAVRWCTVRTGPSVADPEGGTRAGAGIAMPSLQSDGELGGPGALLNTADGRVRWTAPGRFGQAVSGTGTVVFGALTPPAEYEADPENGTGALSVYHAADGRRLWHLPGSRPGSVRYALGITGDRVLLVEWRGHGDRGRLTARDRQNGRTVWSHPVRLTATASNGDDAGSLAAGVTGGLVLTAPPGGDRLVARRAGDGSRVWSARLPGVGPSFNGPTSMARAGRYLYAVADRSTGGTDTVPPSGIVIIDLATGRTGHALARSGREVDGLVAADGRLLVQTGNLTLGFALPGAR